MASTLTKVLVHITFATKERVALIPAAVEPDLYAYAGGICRRMGSPLLAMNGTSDHVHMLVSLGKTVTLADLMLNIKRDSSKWIKSRDAALREFGWQDGYFAFSIGESGVEALQAYISSQKEHHKRTTFKDEVRELLRRHRIKWDERYVWD
jgi:REP element-mobilizing transposase RayT